MFLGTVVELVEGRVFVAPRDMEVAFVVAGFFGGSALFVWFVWSFWVVCRFQVFDGLEEKVQQFGGLVVTAFQVKE